MGGTVIDVNDGSTIPNAVVVIYKTHIETVAPAAGFEIPESAEQIDVTGKFLIPGLIDAHAHVRRWALPRYLAYGITTVRDLHGQADSIAALRDEVNLGAIPGPRMFIAGCADRWTQLDLPRRCHRDIRRRKPGNWWTTGC